MKRFWTYRNILALILWLALCTGVVQSQQQQMYTQFMYNKLAINPAFAGNEEYLTATMIYRDQWVGFPGAPNAQVFNVNLPRLGPRVGVGFHVERQSIGITEKVTYEGMYAYKFFLGPGTLSMGINVSGRNYVLDYTDPRLFGVQDIRLDPSIPQTRESRQLFNAGFGLYFNTNTFFIGGSIPRMIRGDLDFDDNQLFSTEVRHLMIMTGGTFRLDKDWRLTPQFLFRAAENTPFSLDFNFSGTWKETYTMGLTYRTGGAQQDWGESLDLIFGFQISERMLMGFAYDITLAKIRNSSAGSIELMLNYVLVPRKRKTVVINPRYF